MYNYTYMCVYVCIYIYLHNMYNMFPWQIAHRLQRFNPTTPSSCSSPTSRQIWAACHRRHNAICWRGIATSEPCWGQHFFEFPIVAAGGGKSEGLRKAFFFTTDLFFLSPDFERMSLCFHVFWSVKAEFVNMSLWFSAKSWELFFWFIYSW